MSDCAEHPADIQVATWSEVTCAGCQEQSYNGVVPTVACASDDESYSTASSGSGGGDDVASQTPAPTTASTPVVGGGDDVAAQTPVPTASPPVVDGEVC